MTPDQHATDEPRVTVEDVLGEFGFRLRWRVKDYWADVEAFEVEAIFDPGGLNRREFLERNSSGGEWTPDIDNAEHYLKGHVKWDGCTELDMGCPHWCGPDAYARHAALLKHIYHRAFELMGRVPDEKWPD